MFKEHEFQTQCCTTLWNKNVVNLVCNAQFERHTAFIHCSIIVLYGRQYLRFNFASENKSSRFHVQLLVSRSDCW